MAAGNRQRDMSRLRIRCPLVDSLLERARIICLHRQSDCVDRDVVDKNPHFYVKSRVGLSLNRDSPMPNKMLLFQCFLVSPGTVTVVTI